MPLNANTYAWASSASESDITLTASDANLSRCIVTNPTAYAVTITSGKSSATAAFPTSATVPVACQIVPSNTVMTYNKIIGHDTISIISGTADSGKYVYVTVGTGE